MFGCCAGGVRVRHSASPAPQEACLRTATARCWRCSLVSLLTARGAGWCWGGLPPVKLLDRLLAGDTSGQAATSSSCTDLVLRCSLFVMAGGRNTPVPDLLLFPFCAILRL